VNLRWLPFYILTSEKKVEAAFFSKYIQGYVQKGEEGWCVRLKNIVITSETKLFRWFWSKGGESLNQASHTSWRWVDGGDKASASKKSKPLLQNCCFADRSPNTAAGWEPTKEDWWSHKNFSVSSSWPLPMSLHLSNISKVFLILKCLADKCGSLQLKMLIS